MGAKILINQLVIKRCEIQSQLEIDYNEQKKLTIKLDRIRSFNDELLKSQELAATLPLLHDVEANISIAETTLDEIDIELAQLLMKKNISNIQPNTENTSNLFNTNIFKDKEPQSLEDAIEKTIKDIGRFSKNHDIAFAVSIRYPKFKSSHQDYTKSITATLTRLKNKGRIDNKKIGDSNKNTYWGLSKWKDHSGEIISEYMYEDYTTEEN